MIVPHAAVAVIGRQMSTVPVEHTVAVAFGAVSLQMSIVTVPVEVHPVVVVTV